MKRTETPEGVVFSLGEASVTIEARAGWIAENNYLDVNNHPWSGTSGKARQRAELLRDLADCLEAAADEQEGGAGEPEDEVEDLHSDCVLCGEQCAHEGCPVGLNRWGY